MKTPDEAGACLEVGLSSSVIVVLWRVCPRHTTLKRRCVTFLTRKSLGESYNPQDAQFTQGFEITGLSRYLGQTAWHTWLAGGNLETLEFLEKETGEKPAGCVIWMHGLGADATDFEPIVPLLPLDVSLRFVFPNAPVRPLLLTAAWKCGDGTT